ncbi:MAG: hypothetical protein KDA17_07655 [Candidatus Saccharibacteria bacterium]|nr:hypothetical protein [Candidatus Saccharibacteria bacterium]
MNFLQLVQRFRQETNYANTGPTTVVNQVGDHSRAIDWVIDAYRELQNREFWRWMRKSFTLTTSQGVDTYDYTSCIDTPTGVAISRFKAWCLNNRYNRPKCYLNSTGVSAEYYLTYTSWDSFSQMYKIGTQNQGQPAFITVDPGDNIVVGPSPDDAYVITGEYQRGAQVLSDNTEEPDMPVDYHMLIVYLAMEDAGYFDSADEVLLRSQRKGRRILRQLEGTQLPKLRKAGPLA